MGVLESALEGFFLYMSKSSFSVAASGPLPFLLSAVYRRVHYCFSRVFASSSVLYHHYADGIKL